VPVKRVQSERTASYTRTELEMECKHEPARRGDSWGGPTTTTSSILDKTGAKTSLERQSTNILEKDDHCGVKAKPGLKSCQMERKTSKYFHLVYNFESKEQDMLQYTCITLV